MPDTELRRHLDRRLLLHPARAEALAQARHARVVRCDAGQRARAKSHDGLELDASPAPEPGLDAAHIFVTRYADMEAKLAMLRPLIDPAGFVWVSWPKRASKVDTDITEDRIRDAILPATDWVDVKVCAVDEIWSGLKLVIRKAAR